MQTLQWHRTILLAILLAAVGIGRTNIAQGDILVSTYDDHSVERFNETTFAPTAGNVPSFANGLVVAQGLAVAPDNTFYVSSAGTGKIQHYGLAGNFLGEISNAAMGAPSTLAFGPNGNLFVADFANSAVLEFTPAGALVGTAADVPTAPGGFTWDSNDDLIVSELFGPITRFHNGVVAAELVAASQAVTPAGLLMLDGGDFLIANLFGSNILRYQASDQMVVPYAVVENPIGPGDPFPDPMFPSNGPSALVIDGDSLLVVVSGPDHNHTGEIQRFNLATGDYIESILDGLGAPTALAFIPEVPEPSTWLLAAMGAAGFALASWRRVAHNARVAKSSATSGHA